MARDKGNRTRVMKRWGSDDGSYIQDYKPRKPFKGEAQFNFDELYISPFTHELTTDEYGRTLYTPLTPNFTPTGVNVMDEYIQALQAGLANIADFCDRHNAKTSDLDGLVFMLTGTPNLEFRNRWMIRCADELLRYTDMSIPEVARRCGAGSRNNLYFICERDHNCSPTTRRSRLRQDGDLGRFVIIEQPEGK